MSAELENELHYKVIEMRQKYVYFLLAAVGACIGFAVTQSGKALLDLWSIPLGVSLLLWGVSFYLGCRYLHYRSVTLATNAAIIKLLDGRHELAGQDPTAQKMGLETFGKNVEINSHKSGFCYRWQLWLFIGGVIFFLAWHIIEMWRRIPENMCLWV